MAVEKVIRIGIADDHEILSLGVRHFLEEQSDFRVIAEAANGQQGLELVRTLRPEVLILDIRKSGQSGIELMPHLLANDTDLKIVVLSGFSEEHHALSLLRSGAINKTICNGPLHSQLSDRELQVVLRLSKDETVGRIVQELSLSVKSVSTYRSRTMKKLSLASNSDLTYYAIKNDLIQ
jgi:two-component system, NarL family, invasion response regulator UvrY